MTSEASPWRVEVFYDGECPLCVLEINGLRRLDRRRGRIRFTDLKAPGSALPRERSYAELMDRIHGRLPSGELIEGVEVSRQLYAAAGLGPLVWLTRAPAVSQRLELGYRWFARNRLRLTGRCERGANGACQLEHAA